MAEDTATTARRIVREWLEEGKPDWGTLRLAIQKALEARSVPDGTETTAEEIAELISYGGNTIAVRLARDHDTLAAALVATRQELAETILVLDSTKANADRLLAAKDAEIAAEKEEREAAEAAYDKLLTTWNESRDRHLAAEARAERAEAALRPFANALDPNDDREPDDWDLWEAPEALDITIGHLRAARAVLSNKTGES